MSVSERLPSEIDPNATQVYAHLFHTLGDSTRLALLQHLASGEHRVRDLMEHLGYAQSTVSKHLSYLLECGLVTVRPAGRASWYALAQPALLASLINTAESLLTATGKDAVLDHHLRQAHPTQL